MMRLGGGGTELSLGSEVDTVVGFLVASDMNFSRITSWGKQLVTAPALSVSVMVRELLDEALGTYWSHSWIHTYARR